jgi:2-methylcitrate dehydratase
LTTALPMGVHRWGALSMTKGASTAFAVRNGLFCAMLARDGFTSAPEPVEGLFGLWAATGKFTPRLPVSPGGPSAIEMSHQKLVPAESQVLGLLDLVPDLRAWTPTEDIAAIDIVVSERAKLHIADPAKYDPQTRETADHSLPYLLAVALTDGEISLDSYRPERYTDQALRPLMNKVHVTGSAEFTRVRDQIDGVTRVHPMQVTVRTYSGRSRTEELRYHKGHFADPLTQADLELKFARACRGIVGSQQQDRIRAAWWDIGLAADVAEPIALLAHFDPPEDDQ